MIDCFRDHGLANSPRPGELQERAMDVEEIRAKVKQAISTILETDPASISDGASYVNDLGLDSLAILEIVVHAEQQFNIKLPDQDLSKARTVEDTVQLISRLLSAKAS